MHEPDPNSDKQGDGKSRILVLIMLGIVVASIAAFLLLRPNPSGTGHDTPTSSHAPTSQ
jgi:flagellar basal body-associated protein FliL